MGSPEADPEKSTLLYLYSSVLLKPINVDNIVNVTHSRAFKI